MGGSKKRKNREVKRSTKRHCVLLGIFILADLALVASVFFVLRETPGESIMPGGQATEGREIKVRLQQSTGNRFGNHKDLLTGIYHQEAVGRDFQFVFVRIE